MAQQPLVCQGSLIIELHDHTHNKIGRTPLKEWSARRRDLYLTNNTHKRQTSMTPVGFEPANPTSEWLQTHKLCCTATGIDTTEI